MNICSSCGDQFTGEAHGYNGRIYCGNCYADLKVCGMCGAISNRCFEDVIGDYICSECWGKFQPRLLEPESAGRGVGYEFEFLYTDTNDAMQRLKELRNFGQLKEDGSIECEDLHCCSVELSTHFGSGRPLWDMVEAICKIVDHKCFRFNSSCGLHMHIGMHRSREQNRRRIYFWWQALEPAIQLLVPSIRHCSQFARPARQCQYAHERYCSLNSSAYRSSHANRTFEVRLHHMSFDEQVIRGWTQFVIGFFDTFGHIEPKSALVESVFHMTNREKLLFMMQQTRAPLSIWRYAVNAMRMCHRNLPEMLNRMDPMADNYTGSMTIAYQEAE